MNYLCIDIGGTNLKYAVLNDQFEILDQNVQAAGWNRQDEFLEDIFRLYSSAGYELSGIAVSYCGEVDSKSGMIINGGSYQFNNGFNLKKVLEEKYGTRVAINSDSNCATIAELKRGSLKNVENAVVLVIGTGLGCGIVINGTIYEGRNSFAGAVSFSQADMSSDLNWSNCVGGRCGIRGLLDEYQDQTGTKVNGVEFFDLVNSDDEVAAGTLKKYVKNLSAYIYNIQAVLDVEAFAIGGGISVQPKLMEYLIEAVSAKFEELPVRIKKPEIYNCEFYNDANLIGAMCMLL